METTSVRPQPSYQQRNPLWDFHEIWHTSSLCIYPASVS